MKNDTIKIVVGEDKFIPYFKKIWKICFGDGDEYIDFFFDNKYSACYAIAAVINDSPVGVTYLMPVSAREYGVLKKGFYLYALGVFPEYQNKGIGKRIVKEICDFCKKSDFFCILSPASEKLAHYYTKLGFIENSYLTLSAYNVQNKYVKIPSFNLTPKKLEAMRSNLCENMIYWDSTSLSYVLNENSFLKGMNFYFAESGKALFAIVRLIENNVTVIESNIPFDFRQKYSDYFGCIFNSSKILWNMPYVFNSETSVLCGMSFNLSKNYYYLNHILN